MFSRASGVVAALLSLACVSAAAVTLHASHPHAVDVSHRAYPCPEDEDILPCFCTWDPNSGNLNLTCSGLSDVDELGNIFNAYFPFTKYNTFTLQDSNIPELPEGIFKTVYFKRMYLINNHLKTVVSGALKNLYSSLEQFHILELFGIGSLYNWPLPDMENFTLLHDVGISGPQDTMLPLVSSSLEEVLLDMHHLNTLPDDAFTNAPNLTKITIQGTLLEVLKPNLFLSQTELEAVDLSNNNLTVLQTSTLVFSSSNLTLLDLSSNAIHTIEPGAIEGVSGPVKIKLNNNQLRELNEDPFAELMTSVTGEIDVSDNPLICGCDLAWIVAIPDDQLSNLKGLQSACGVPEGSYSIETIKEFLQYQCSTSS